MNAVGVLIALMLSAAVAQPTATAPHYCLTNANCPAGQKCCNAGFTDGFCVPNTALCVAERTCGSHDVCTTGQSCCNPECANGQCIRSSLVCDPACVLGHRCGNFICYNDQRCCQNLPGGPQYCVTGNACPGV